MTVELFVNSAPSNKVIKVDRATDLVRSVDGTLREATSLKHPSILLNIDNPGRVNYVYIPEFERYYFVVDWHSERTGLWRANLQCDVLTSFWDRGISTSECVVGRNETQIQYDLIDDQLYFTADSLYGVYESSKNPFSGPASYSVILAGSGRESEAAT